MRSPFLLLVVLLSALSCSVPEALSATEATPTNASSVCPRALPGLELVPAPDIFSANGILHVNMTYQSRLDQDGHMVYCFTADSGLQSPTLHIRAGDELLIRVTNMLPSTLPLSRLPTFRKRKQRAMPNVPGFIISPSFGNTICEAQSMTETSVNVHFHGTNAPPRCYQDEVIKTIINSGQTFQYSVHIPADEPPGLYWYHPHVHGLAEAALLGGASGAIIVEGLETVNHEVAGLPYRTLLFRDSLTPEGLTPGEDTPSWDLSLNYSPIQYPNYLAPTLRMKPGEKQVWRVVNAAADSILDLQLQYDGKTQPLAIVGLDGVPTGSQDNNLKGKTLIAQHIPLAPAQRAEFIVTGPPSTVQHAQFVTATVDTGEDGDSDPQRPVLTILPDIHASEPDLVFDKVPGPPPFPQHFNGLAATKVDRSRNLYFSEVLSDPKDPLSPTNFYITVAGDIPTLFSPDNPPAIVTRQGSVEEWTVENTSLETHAFHIHQIHFLVLEENGVPISGQYRDTVIVPAWSGSGSFPSVKIRLDFRGTDVGDFVYHCHILGHEDNGMMAIIRVLPRE